MKNKKEEEKGNRRDWPTKCNFPEMHPAGRKRTVRKKEANSGLG